MKQSYPDGALARLQAVQVEILGIVASVCDELGLTWFADSGTCLGAVRHGGFIPWDDDVDIAMPIDDYLTFCRVAPEVFEGSDYGIYLPQNTDCYPPLFAKVYKRGTRFVGKQMMEAGFEEAIFVDVFAYARLDSDPRKAMQQRNRFTFWQRVSYLYHIPHPHLPANMPFKPAVHMLTSAAHQVVRRTFTPSGIVKRFFAALDGGDGRGAWTNPFYADWGTFDEQTLFPVVWRAFGDMQVPTPHDADAYLTTLYGDYMQFPPEDQRASNPPVVLDFGDGVNVMEKAVR